MDVAEKCTKLGQIINKTWGVISDDMFMNDEGKYDYDMTFSRGEVAEISLDADRWKDYCTPDEAEAVKWYLSFDIGSEERKNILRRALPFAEFVQ